MPSLMNREIQWRVFMFFLHFLKLLATDTLEWMIFCGSGLCIFNYPFSHQKRKKDTANKLKGRRDLIIIEHHKHWITDMRSENLFFFLKECFDNEQWDFHIYDFCDLEEDCTCNLHAISSDRTRGEKIYSEREPLVSVELSAISLSNLRRKKTGLSQTESAIFVDSAPTKEQP